MEENKATIQTNDYDYEYDSKLYRFGRITTIIFLLLLWCVPLSMSIIWNIGVDIPTTLAALFTPLSMFLIVGTVQVFTLAPVLGAPATFMSFNNGDTLLVTMPAVVSAQKISGYNAGTRNGEIVSMIGAAVSVITCKIVLFIGFVGISFILPVLQSPVLQPAFRFFIPALLGALVFPAIKKDVKAACVPVVAVAIATLIVGYSVFTRNTPYIMPFVIILSVLWRYVLYRKENAKKAQEAVANADNK